MDISWARLWHLLTAVVALAALAAQLVLVVSGASVLVEEDPPGLPARLYRFAAYFTIQSNALVAIGAITLVRDPHRDGRSWRILRLGGVVGIAVTGLVHVTLLRPLLNLEGWSYVCDRLLHVAVPLLAVAGWLAFGPRPRVTAREVGWALGWPVVWLAGTLAVGSLSGWFPYPFLNFDREGWSSVLVACVGITMLLLAGFGAAALVDRRLGPAPPT